MKEQDIVAASNRLVELSTQRELTEEQQTELTVLREQLADQPDVDSTEEDFMNPLVTKPSE